MTWESVAWFSAQIVGLGLAAIVGLRVSRRETRVWKTAACIATMLMLFWPLMRLIPAQVIRLLGAHCVIFIEITGIVIPATTLFVIAACKGSSSRDRRAVALLVPVCLLYFLRNGVWMVRPGVPDLGSMHISGNVCLQTTGYTCVAASMVTMLRAYGIDATETQAARLSHTEIGWGTTDSRAVAGLETRLTGLPVDVSYERMDYNRLMQVPKPCMVSVKWGYFVSHMVPVLEADDKIVRTGDPLKGISLQTPNEFQAVWHKNGIFLVDHRSEVTARR